MSIDLIFYQKMYLVVSIKKIPGGPLVSLQPTKYNRKEGYNSFMIKYIVTQKIWKNNFRQMRFFLLKIEIYK